MELCNPTLLKAKTVAGMLTPSIKITKTYSWGLGIGLCRTSAGGVAWHWGDNVIYQNLMAILPKEQCGVVVMTNSSNGLQTAIQVALSLLNYCIANPIDLSKLESFPF
jgi:CubicO group peptidase (beta-lactamase class C family)